MKQEILTLLPPGHPWGQQLHHFPSIDSTNSYAKELAHKGAAHGTVVTAGMQTGGRGRLGRSFSSPAGLGLYLSVILRPDCRPEQLMHLTCAVGVAAAEAVEKASGISPGIKWTNDLVIGKRKLGGILTELSVDASTGLVDFAVVGIGINCRQTPMDFPADIRDIACSLAMEGSDISPPLLAARLIEQLHALDLAQKTQIMAHFRQRCVTLGREISLLRGDEVRHGKAIEIMEDGALLVEFPNGHTEAVTSGEVSIRGMYGYL